MPLRSSMPFIYSLQIKSVACKKSPPFGALNLQSPQRQDSKYHFIYFAYSFVSLKRKDLLPIASSISDCAMNMEKKNRHTSFLCYELRFIDNISDR